MNKFQISNFGPIKNLDVELGDLTILLGPQASGKTLFLQLAKLIVDKDYIVQNLLKYNYVVDGDSDKVLNYYFGDRLSSMWKNSSSLCCVRWQAWQASPMAVYVETYAQEAMSLTQPWKEDRCPYHTLSCICCQPNFIARYVGFGGFSRLISAISNT